MKKIYIDYDFKCHVTDDGTMTAVETDFFDGKCNTFIEGYRFIPYGETWVRSDGVVFSGEMAAPWKDYQFLETAQKLYEEMNAAAIKEERIQSLESENTMLAAQVGALSEQMDFYEECIVEMAEVIYA